MEFPSLGRHCGVATCATLDFLPVRCAHCEGSFCGEHRLSHGCASAPEAKAPVALTEPLAAQPCALDGCSRLEVMSFRCGHCQASFCGRHRIAEQHDCAALPGPDPATLPPRPDPAPSFSAPEVPDTSLERLRAAVAKNSKVAAKVLLMKMKMSALGEATVAPVERLHFIVHLPKDRSHKGKADAAVFVSKAWTAGRAVDSLARLLALPNPNDPEAPKLRLWSQDGQPIPAYNSIADQITGDCPQLLLEYDQ